jgi:hypothetical protein
MHPTTINTHQLDLRRKILDVSDIDQHHPHIKEIL